MNGYYNSQCCKCTRMCTHQGAGTSHIDCGNHDAFGGANYNHQNYQMSQNQMGTQYVYDVVNKILAALLRIEEKLK